MVSLRRTRMLAAVLLLTGGVGILGGALSPVAVAAQAQPEILVSSDGVHYSTSLDADLFDGLGVLIPGQAQSVTLWVKNPTASAAEMRLSATEVDMPWPDFATNVTMSAADSMGHATSGQTLASLADCEVILGPQRLAAGESVALTLTFALADVPEAVAQNSGASLNLRVAMRDAAAGAFPDSACNDGGVTIGSAPMSTPSGTLARSGFNAEAPLLLLGGLGAGGLLFFLLGRRRVRDAR